MITKIQFLPCLPDLSVMNDKMKGKKRKKGKRERNRKKRNMLLSVFTIGSNYLIAKLILSVQKGLIPGNATITLGPGTSRKDLLLLTHNLNSNAIHKLLRQVYKKHQTLC